MLIKYEFLKILRRKSTIIVMILSLLIITFLFGLPIIQYQSYYKDGVIKGSEGISYTKAQYEELSVSLTDQYIAQIIREYQSLFQDPANVGNDGNEKFLIGDAYWNFVSPRTKLLNTIAANYDDPGENSGYNKLPDLDIESGSHFYQIRDEKINHLLNDPSRKLSKEQIVYWEHMNHKVKMPFSYGYYEGWEVIISCFELLIFPILAVCIVIAPVFSGEYQTGMDAVILAGKYGKTKLLKAKMVASFLFGVAAFTLHVIGAFAIPLISFGIDGWNLPLQVAGTTVPYPLSFMQATFINLGVIYLLLLALIGLTLFLSAKMKSSYLVLTILVPVLFIPLFLTVNGATGLYNKILLLLPYRSTMPEFSKFVSYQFGGVVLDVLSVRGILYGMLSVITLPLAGMAFKRHQISR